MVDINVSDFFPSVLLEIHCSEFIVLLVFPGNFNLFMGIDIVSGEPEYVIWVFLKKILNL